MYPQPLQLDRLFFPHARLDRHGSTPGGYPRYAACWPRVAGACNSLVYLDKNALWKLNGYLGRGYQEPVFPRQLELTVWAVRHARNAYEQEQTSAFLGMQWACDQLFVHSSHAYNQRYDSQPYCCRASTGVIHSLYVPNALLPVDTCSTVVVTLSAPTADELLARRFAEFN